MESENAEKWKKALQEEMDSIKENKTWELVDKPNGRKVVACKWVYKTKLGAKGELIKHKARLVAKGFSQIPGQDYDDTFAPVSRYESLRLLLAAAHSAGWEISQMDVKSAFLNGNLKEEIYMAIPPGINAQTGKVCRLKKCIYGLKQASREWYIRLSEFLVQNGFQISTFDPCVLISPDMIVDIYVDDITMFARLNEGTKRVKDLLKSKFKMTDLGKANWILGIAISYEDNKLKLDQTAYIDKVLERFKMTDCRPVTTPFDSNVTLKKGTEDQTENQTLYQSIVGSLMYATIGTRPDLAYAITTLSQFSSAPNKTHMDAAKRVLRYLKGTRTAALYYVKGDTSVMKGYSDSSYACDPDTRRSVTGNCFFLGNCLVSWNSRKQSTVALSTTEAEYMALSQSARQMVWLRKASESLGLNLLYVLYGDNNGSLMLAKNPVHHKRSKHIDVQYHYVREKLGEKVFSLEYVSTGENVADIFTKSLDKTKHDYFCSFLHCDS